MDLASQERDHRFEMNIDRDVPSTHILETVVGILQFAIWAEGRFSILQNLQHSLKHSSSGSRRPLLHSQTIPMA